MWCKRDGWHDWTTPDTHLNFHKISMNHAEQECLGRKLGPELICRRALTKKQGRQVKPVQLNLHMCRTRKVSDSWW